MGSEANRRPTIILASASPRRQRLLRELGLKFRTAPTAVRERVLRGISPRRVAEQNALRKAQAAARTAHGLILAADTLVATRQGIVGKPKNKRDAIRILSALSGMRHRVITGVCLLDTASGRTLLDSAVTWVTMRKMTPLEIRAYVNSGEAMGKAGAYAIQESGDRYVERVEGSFSNVVGLPLELLRRMLSRFKVRIGSPVRKKREHERPPQSKDCSCARGRIQSCR